MVKYAIALRWLTPIWRGMFEMVSEMSFTKILVLGHSISHIFTHHHHLRVSAVGFHHH
jgi:hypothetical protein